MKLTSIMRKHYYGIYGLLLLMAAATLWSCDSTTKTSNDDVAATPGIDVENIDPSVNPGEDFFKFANGGWLKSSEIPADQSSWGGFNELRDDNQKLLLSILTEAAESGNFAEGSDEYKAIAIFKSGMDSAKVAADGITPLKPWLDKIEGMKTDAELVEVVSELHLHGSLRSPALFGVSVRGDAKNSEIYALYVSQAGLGLPDRSYYDKARWADAKAQYEVHIANMFGLMGDEAGVANEKAAGIVALESRLAKAQLRRVDRRNIDTTYNKMSYEALKQLVPAFGWDAYMANMALQPEYVIVQAPIYLQEVNKVLTETPKEVMKAYFTWHLLNATSSYLSNDYVQERFNFRGKVLSGQKEMAARWKRVLRSVNFSAGEAIGRVYVAKAFPPEAKKKAKEMVDNILEAFGERLDNVDWMGAETKQQAKEKLASFTVKIGYPDKWRDYSKLEVTNSYVLNMMNATKFSRQRTNARLGQKVDRSEWGMSPQTVNAYYNPLNNEIVFPAAILQPPFYNYQADEAVNYGGIGAVIGHEVSHGFDDSGSRFDANGNRRDWWSPEDKAQFKKRTDVLVNQYNSYVVLDSLNVNGRLTLGENIADLCGLSVAYDGLQRYLAANGTPGPIDGYTPDQRFFLSWATIWRVKYRDAALKSRITNDSHSPGMFRANGPLSNFPKFYEAFGLKKGQQMVRSDEERAVIW